MKLKDKLQQGVSSIQKSESSAQKVQGIIKLTKAMKALKQHSIDIDNETSEWAKKRDAAHKQIKDIRLQAAKLRQKRDGINEEVAVLKQQRDYIRTMITNKIRKTKQLRDNLASIKLDRPRNHRNVIQKEYDSIEWKIQTTSLSLEEEKILVEKAEKMREKLRVYQKISNVKQKIAELQDQIKSMKANAQAIHTKLSELAHESQELHMDYVQKIKKIKSIQSHADKYHNSYLESKQRYELIHKEHAEKKGILFTLKNEITEQTEKERFDKQEEKKKKLKKEISKKLKQGKKLTFEEFKLLQKE